MRVAKRRLKAFSYAGEGGPLAVDEVTPNVYACIFCVYAVGEDNILPPLKPSPVQVAKQQPGVTCDD